MSVQRFIWGYDIAYFDARYSTRLRVPLIAIKQQTKLYKAAVQWGNLEIDVIKLAQNEKIRRLTRSMLDFIEICSKVDHPHRQYAEPYVTVSEFDMDWLTHFFQRRFDVVRSYQDKR